jgi:hypothetical protein
VDYEGLRVKILNRKSGVLGSFIPAEGAELPLGALGAEHQDLFLSVLVELTEDVRAPAGRELIALGSAFDAGKTPPCSSQVPWVQILPARRPS